MASRFMMLFALLFQVASASLSLGTASHRENPMRKIITMLQDMQGEIEREGEVEKELFDKALCACEGGEKDLERVIADSTAGIDEYTAKYASLNAEKAQLTQEVADHKGNKEGAEKDLAKATMLREKDHSRFVKEEKDTKMNLASLSKAIPAIEQGMGGASLMQLSGATKLQRFIEVTQMLSSEDRSGVLAFLAQGSADATADTVQAPQSGQILGILKNMKDEMEKDLGELQEQETTDLQNFNNLKAAKTEEINVNAKSIISKEKPMGANAVEASEAKHALEDAEKELANAQKFSGNMKEECAQKVKERDTRAKMRAEEVSAISQAIGILNDDDALEVFSKTKAALIQQPRQTYDALLQIMHTHAPRHMKPRRHLMLLAVSSKLAVKPEAEKLVSGMINGMIGVLHDEDVSDEHKKAWCANETEVSHGIEAEKKTLLEQLTSEISEMEDSMETLTSDIKGLNQKIADLDKMVHESTETRKKEHQEFVDAFATSATAIRLIDKAILRLEKFYSPNKVAKQVKATKEAALKEAGLSLIHKSSREAQHMQNMLLPGGFDSLIQIHETLSLQSQKRFMLAVRDGVEPVAIPETPGATYEKRETGGVMGLMNDFKTDLKTDMTEAETEEKFDSKEYVRIMSDAQESRAQNVKSLNEKKAAKSTTHTKLVSAKEQKELTDEELHNIELYLVHIHTACDFLLQNFEARHEGRIESESGLESAKTIVTDGTPPTHREISNRYDEEVSKQDVDEHFPGTPVAP